MHKGKMFRHGVKRDPQFLSDPKISTLLTSTSKDSEHQLHDLKKKDEILHPATTFEDFLLEENINEWPQRLTSELRLDLGEIDPDLWREEKILRELNERAPLKIDVLSNLKDNVSEYASKLDAFCALVVSNEALPSRLRENLFHAPNPGDLEKARDGDAVSLHHCRRNEKDQRQSMAQVMQASRSKSIDYTAFTGFRKNELTELPSQLEAPQLLNKITEAQQFNKGFGQLWRKIFLSEATVSLLQDTFWWLFLEYFEHDPDSQDRLYTRIATSYVTLFLSINADIRDKILQVFPRCFAQCVYLAFREAFPESQGRLAEEFLADLYSTISEWMSGVKPPVNEWKAWPWDKICSLPGGTKSQTLPRQDQDQTYAAETVSKLVTELQTDFTSAVGPSTSVPVTTPYDRPGITISVPSLPTYRAKQRSSVGSEKSVRQEIALSVPKAGREISTPPTQLRESSSRPVKKDESAQTGPGPDYERVIFNIGGRSPLVVNYLFMKQLREKRLVGRLMKRTEVLRHPPAAPTFQDVIRHSKKTIRDLHLQRTRMMALTVEESSKQENLRKNFAAETRRMQNALKDPVEIKMRSDRVLDQAVISFNHNLEPNIWTFAGNLAAVELNFRSIVVGETTFYLLREPRECPKYLFITSLNISTNH